jgi:pimeloyl-ACP methyl ester carboxylesterase
MTITERTIDIGPVTLAVREAGAGGRPLLLIHGFTGASTDFADFLEPLADAGWHVVAPDLRGHGASSHPTSEDDYSFALFAADVLALADALGFDRFTVLGHSMGGMIVQVVALDAPERVEALVLMDTSHGPLHVDPDLVALGVEVARAQGIDVVADVMGSSDDGPLTTEAYRRKVAEDPGYAEMGDRNLRASSPAMFAAMLAGIPQAADRLDALAGLTMATLVIVGEQDAPFLEDSRRMADTIPGGRLAVIADGGHSPQFEAPDAWWDALSGFLADVTEGREQRASA